MPVGWWGLILALLAGCGFEISGGTSPGDATRDAAIGVNDAVDAVDDDDDGILDVTDNCPLTANVDQHDEDADSKGDRCDPCPQIAGADTDVDGDGIGGACDPHPSVAGDVLVMFDGFPTDLALPTGWTQIGGFNGDWAVQNGALRIDTNDTPHFLRFNAQAGHTTIDLELDAVLPGSNVPSVTAIVDGDAALTTFTACSVLYTEQSRRLQSFSSGVFTQIVASPGAVSVPGTHRIVATADGSGIGCGFSPGGALGVSTPSNGRMSVGIRVRNLRVAIHYVAIYRSP